jgi:chromosome partitioning protein
MAANRSATVRSGAREHLIATGENASSRSPSSADDATARVDGEPLLFPSAQCPDPIERGVVQVNSTRVFAIANQKGGVGKTTTSINLAAYLADAGRKTLVVDLDPQSNTTTGLGVDPHHLGNSIYEVLVTHAVPVTDAIKPEVCPNLSLLPAKVDLYAADIELVYMEDRERRLEKALAQVKDRYDYILIDCPPSLGLLTVNALTAADGVILPLQCEYFALEGMQQLLKTIKLVRDRLNPQIGLFGVVLTMYDPRTKLANEIVKEIRDHFPKEKFETIVNRNVRLSEAPSFGLTILQHDPRSPGALAYKSLAEEVIARAEGVTSNA